MGETSIPATRGRWLRTNQGIAALLAAGFIGLILYLWLQEWTHREMRDGFLLGFFSLMGALACLLCCLAMLVDRFRHQVEEDIAAVGALDWLLALVVLLILYGFYALAWRIGFILAAPIFLTAATYILGARPWWSALAAGLGITLGIAIALYAIGIDLPAPFFLN